MAVRLNDLETERLVVERGLLSEKGLARYHAMVAEDPSFTFFDLLVAEGVIPYDVLVELEQVPGNGSGAAGASIPPPQPARAPSGGAAASAQTAAPNAPPGPRPAGGGNDGFFTKPGAPPRFPDNRAAPAVSAAPTSGRLASGSTLRRRLRRRFEEPAGAAGAAGAAVTPAPPPQNIPAAPATPAAPAASVVPPAPPAPAAPTVPAVPTAPGTPAAPAQAPPSSPAPDVESKTATPEGWPGGLAPEDPAPGGIQDILKKARAFGASDLHLSVGLPPMVRVHGALRPLEEGHPPLKPEETVRLIQMMLTPTQWAYFDRGGDLDFCYAFSSGGRFRTNVLRQRNGDDLVCRIIGEQIFTMEELGIPPQAKRLTEFAQGLVLVTGPLGHGKTTTMMALVELVNQNRPEHIIAVEEPIEYLLEGKSCQVTQREVGPHTASFATALRAALREDPDIIVIGDLRDYETTSMAINAAETGHLVFCSLPTQDAARTIDKVLDYFPPAEQAQIRLMVSGSLRGILSQQLIPRKDGKGRVAAMELLFNSVAVGNIIREANTAGLVNAMQLGKRKGMVLMDESLMALVEKDLIAGEEAYLRAMNKQKFKQWAPKS